ncbi:MAG: DUF2752 domain-containing protein [Lachnospiraceae bacterium]|nr:DUF2752 domain-containing protein [Lachnospiraceae bacterium]
MKKRAIKVTVFSVVLLLCGVLYGLFCMATGVAIPCVFYQVTGFSCPGCGVTRMCINILKGNIPEAVKCNPALFFCSIPLTYVLIDGMIRYIKTGTTRPRKWQEVLLCVMIAVLLVHGVLRNINF